METINLQYLDRLYDDLHKQNEKLLATLKAGLNVEDVKKAERLIQREMSITSALMTQTLKLRNLKKQAI